MDYRLYALLLITPVRYFGARSGTSAKTPNQYASNRYKSVNLSLASDLNAESTTLWRQE